MIQDKTIDEALIELMRCQRALEALRKARKDDTVEGKMGCTAVQGKWTWYTQGKQHAAAKRASLDLTRKLADLRAGR